MSYRVIFSPEAEEQLVVLYIYIAAKNSPSVAKIYIDAIVGYCEGMCNSPHRGTVRDDVRPGLRITNYKGSAVIAFDVVDELVSVIGVFYGGQDYETILRDEFDNGLAH